MSAGVSLLGGTGMAILGVSTAGIPKRPLSPIADEAESAGGASRGPRSSMRGARMWSIPEIPV